MDGSKISSGLSIIFLSVITFLVKKDESFMHKAALHNIIAGQRNDMPANLITFCHFIPGLKTSPAAEVNNTRKNHSKSPAVRARFLVIVMWWSGDSPAFADK